MASTPPTPSTPAPAPNKSSAAQRQISPSDFEIPDEQRSRSAYIEAVGVERWKMEHDERPVAERPFLGDDGYLHNPLEGQKQVPGAHAMIKDDGQTAPKK